ncbi:hypothetical protein [Hansschlegelia zhihuaiae]|uniref:DUF5666 domain-containing protein n=1 Tax=Hansschlegelia zhihuaiae TaxID=405005 RepID=A0A4Q0MLK7_9HYPH|nr:hypothetical protein [Hansschlegelia zhihuaiae]RXF74588.1 hypothetical protein EK403_04090 [Hansschlegelia zhihuaiae]
MKRYGATVALAVGATLLAAGPALAVTVANETDKALEVTADLGAQEPKTKIEPGKSAKLDCPEGCEIRVEALNSYGVAAKTGAKLVIKDGMLKHADAAKASK